MSRWLSGFLPTKLLQVGPLLLGLGSAGVAQSSSATLLADLAGDDLATRRRALAAMAGSNDPALEAGLVRMLRDETRFPEPEGTDGCISFYGGRPPRYRPRSGLIEPRELRWKTPSIGISGPSEVRGIQDEYDLFYPWSPRVLAAHALGRLERLEVASVRALVDSLDRGGCAASESWLALLRHRELALPLVAAAFERSPDNTWGSLLIALGDAVRPRLGAWVVSDHAELRYRARKLAIFFGVTPGVAKVFGNELHGSPSESEAAAVWLFDSGPRMVPLLLTGLRSAKLHVRANAAAALAMVRVSARSKAAPPFPPAVVNELIELAREEEKSPAHWALRALARADLDAVLRQAVRDLLLNKLDSELPIQREIGCVHLGAIAGLADTGVLQRLESMRRDRNRSVALAAHKALQAIDERKWFERASQPEFLEDAVREAMAKRPAERRRRRLTELVAKSQQPELLWSLADKQWPSAVDWLLRRGGDRVELTELLEIRWRNTDRGRRDDTLELAAKMPKRVVVPMAVSVLEDPSAKKYERVAAIDALTAQGAIGGYVAEVFKLLDQDVGADAMANALISLPKERLRRERARVFELLAHESQDVRRAAARVARHLDKDD